MNKQQFSELAKQSYTHIPVYREVAADLDTPLSAYLKLANCQHSFLFESVQGGERWGRYSIIGLQSCEHIKIHGKTISVFNDNNCIEQITHADPLQWIDEYRNQYKVPEVAGLPRFVGGLVGYFGYDTIRYIEPKLGACLNPDEFNTADILLMLSREILVFDSLKGSVYVVVLAQANNGGYEQANLRIDKLAQQLQAPVSLSSLHVSQQQVSELDFVSGFSESGFKQAVEKAKQYITAGDVMQVVLSQRLNATFKGKAIDVYRHLRRLNPSPYMYYLNLGDFEIVGSSPEILVRQERDEVTVRPIAGTRPRGSNEQHDIALEKELLAEPNIQNAYKADFASRHFRDVN